MDDVITYNLEQVKLAEQALQEGKRVWLQEWLTPKQKLGNEIELSHAFSRAVNVITVIHKATGNYQKFYAASKDYELIIEENNVEPTTEKSNDI